VSVAPAQQGRSESATAVRTADPVQAEGSTGEGTLS